ncbi:hypothetical protein Hanom_Chr05g00429041 [Helianthus anomalus]
MVAGAKRGFSDATNGGSRKWVYAGDGGQCNVSYFRICIFLEKLSLFAIFRKSDRKTDFKRPRPHFTRFLP